METVNTKNVEEAFQKHFKCLPLSMDDDRLIYDTVQRYGEDMTLSVMRNIYKQGSAKAISSFNYIKRAVEIQSAKSLTDKDPSLLQDDSFKSDAQKEREKQWLRDGVARSRRALSVKGYLSGLAREAAGKETVLAIDSWVKNGGKRPDEAIKTLGEMMDKCFATATASEEAEA